MSAGAGALSGGISSVSKLKNAHKLIKAGVEVAVDASASAANQAVTTGEIDPVNLAIDVAAAQSIGKVVSRKVETNAKSSPEGKVLAREANRTNRMAGNRPSRQARGAEKIRFSWQGTGCCDRGCEFRSCIHYHKKS